MCEEKRESLSTVLSYLCAFGHNDATGLINNAMEDVASKKGVKRALQDLAGEETYAHYIESLRVPDWVLLFFKTCGRISNLNITQLGSTGSANFLFIYSIVNLSLFSQHFDLNKFGCCITCCLTRCGSSLSRFWRGCFWRGFFWLERS